MENEVRFIMNALEGKKWQKRPYSTREINKKLNLPERYVTKGLLRDALMKHAQWKHVSRRTYQYIGDVDFGLFSKPKVTIEKSPSKNSTEISFLWGLIKIKK